MNELPKRSLYRDSGYAARTARIMTMIAPNPDSSRLLSIGVNVVGPLSTALKLARLGWRGDCSDSVAAGLNAAVTSQTSGIRKTIPVKSRARLAATAAVDLPGVVTCGRCTLASRPAAGSALVICGQLAAG